MVIGVTGQIGAGKSTAAGILADFGAHVIDADEIGRKVVDRELVLQRKLTRRFGDDILDRKGRVRRKLLAERAFENTAARDALNRVVHPYLLRELRRQLRAARRHFRLVVIDAALLLYWGMDREVDYVLVIHTGRRRRLRRLARRGISRADAEARERLQLPYEEFRKRADRLLLNNGSKSDLRRKLLYLRKYA